MHGLWKKLGLAAALCVVASLGAGVAMAGEISWRTGSAELAPMDPASLAQSLSAVAAGDETRHVVVELAGPASQDERETLARNGLTLLNYVGNNAYFASVAADRLEVNALAANGLVSASAIEPRWKMDPRVLADDVPNWAVVSLSPKGGKTVALYVVFHKDVALGGEALAVLERHGVNIIDTLETINGFVVELPHEEVEVLAAEDAVQWVEWPLPQWSELNNSNSVITEANEVQAAPYNLDGSGVTVLVYDGGYARASHVDFQGRLTVRDSSGLSDHATHVAGTVGGAGVANSAYEGMAPGVIIESYGFEYSGGGIFLYSNPGDIESDYDQAINSYGADISNNSIGTNTAPNGFPCDITGDYGVTSAMIDSIVVGSLGSPFRIVWANGNERQTSRCGSTYNTTAPPACAKNHITVGAMNSNNDSVTSFTSWGPADDGRIKPDISGPGCQSNDDGGVTSTSSSGNSSYSTKCGTSMAAPTVTGLSALLLEDFRAQYPSEPDFRNSTLKALLAHNAEDIQNTGPDYQTGYGSVRIKRTIDFMRAGNFEEQSLTNGDVYTTYVLVEGGDGEVKVTLTWDDEPAVPNVANALVNDLDLRVYDPSGGRHYPWTLNPASPSSPAVRNQEDHTNNIEQVYVNSPQAGVWRVEVHGTSVPAGPQVFSLAASPRLAACSSAGSISLESPYYGCGSTAVITVADCDLNTNNNTIQTVSVNIASTSEPGGESVLLTETGPATAEFRGSIDLSTTNGSGVLLVADGDLVTATYNDADDGSGSPAIVTATADVTCQGPAITNVQVTSITATTATVTFDTSRSATGTVRYGLSCGSLTSSEADAGGTTIHSITLTGLSFDTAYAFQVEAEDAQGNVTVDDNGGLCYSFSTPNVAYAFDMSSNPGWSLNGLWAYGQPTGGGGDHGGPDPTSGFTGPNVVGYNLNGDYENNLPETNATTPALDFTGYTDVTMSFQRWLGVEQPQYDHAYLRVSNNGSTWVTIWENTAEVADSSWSYQEFDLSAYADDESSVQVRWVMGTTDYTWQYCGWNIDDVEFIAVGGVQATCDDGILNQGEERIDCGGPCPACECTSDGDCSDGAFCNGSESCDAYGECQAGVAPCSGQFCDEGGDRCVDCLNDTHCADGMWCNGDETCVDGTCEAGTAVDCDDGVACTVDSCDEANDECNHVANDALCDNGLYCDGAETCDEVNGCEAGMAVLCDDGVDCTIDTCDEGADACAFTPDDAFCDDGLFCNGVETCDGVGGCQAGSDPCPGQFCDEVGDVCVECFGDGDCDDGVFCNGAEACVAGVCEAGADPCPGQACDEADDICVDCIDDGDCNDGVFCNGVESCVAGACQAGSDPCPGQFCDEGGDVCVDCLIDEDCADDLFCNGDEACVGGACEAGGDPCPGLLCDEAGDICVECFGDGDCDDGAFCNGSESCVAGLCEDGVEPCDAGEVCDEANDQCLAGPEARLEADVVTVGGTPITVNLVNSYISPVIVCTVNYDNNSVPVVARVTQVTANSFDVYLVNPSGGGVAAEEVGYLVVEEGAWTIDGVNVEAQRYLSTVTDENNSWTGEAQSYLQGYSSPVVLGQVMSDNDAEWSVFWCQGTSRQNPPTASALRTGKTVCEDTLVPRADETVGFIVIEAGHGMLAGVAFEADLGADSVAGVTNAPPYTYTFNTAFAADPLVAIVTMAAVDGGNGGWAYTYGADPITTTSLDLVIDEDQIGDSERNHTTEQVGYLVFEDAVVYPPVAECSVPADCDDGVFCNGAEDCIGGFCVAGGDPCPGELCDEAGDACVECLGDGDCADDLYCNGDEVCIDGACYSGVPVDCDDGVGCTADSCNEATDSCDNVPDDGACDDGFFCNGAEMCDAVLDCVAGADPCPGQSCDEVADLCVDCFDAGDCDDALFCNGAEDCVNGACVAGGDPCPGELCDEDGDVCVECLDDGDCADGLFCNGEEACVDGACFAGLPVDCDDGVDCTIDSCNEATDTCDNVPDDSACANDIWCDGDEFCDPVLGCQDGTDPCPGLTCDEVNDRCVECFGDGDCDDGLWCNGSETCDAEGICRPGTPVNCDDGIGCTTDLCNDGTDSCDYVPDDLACDDGDPCTLDTCFVGSGCEYETLADCCGNGTCEFLEDQCNCPEDCGTPPGSETDCFDGLDNDCDGFIDGDDDDCIECLENGSWCSSDDECCSGDCGGWWIFRWCR
jgi:hypothetical protein